MAAVDAGLEGIALAAAQSLRQAPIGAGASEREAHDRTGREMIIESGRAARRARGEIVAADHREIAVGTIAAAIACAPHGPALLEGGRLRRCLEHLRVGERDVLRQRRAFRRKAERWPVDTADPGAPVDEGIEHQVQELIGELEADFLRAGGGFAGELVQGTGEITAGEAEQRQESGRQRTAIVEEVVNRIADIELVDREG